MKITSSLNCLKSVEGQELFWSLSGLLDEVGNTLSVANFIRVLIASDVAQDRWLNKNRCIQDGITIGLIIIITITSRQVIVHLSEFLNIYSRSLPGSLECSNIGGAAAFEECGPSQVVRCPVRFLSSFKFFRIFFEFPFIECGMAPSAAPTMTGIVSVFVPHILAI